MPRAIAVVLLLCASAAAAPRRGASLGLFSEDAGWSYDGLLEDIARSGATDVELVVPLYQADVEATVVGYHPRFSPPLDRVRKTVREAHRRHLRVLLFPIVRLLETHGPNEWRGTLRPRDRGAWLGSYGERLQELAAIASEEHVAALSIGSELSSLDVDRGAFQGLAAAIRARYGGELVYSANWDHFEQVGVWELVDRVGVCAYFPLAKLGDKLSLPALIGAWHTHLDRLSALSKRAGKALVLTELGYRSQPNALVEPWDEGAAAPVDDAALEAQRLGFAAFAGAIRPAPSWLDGYYVWGWYGVGGARSRGYTPRDKPAMREVEGLLRTPR